MPLGGERYLITGGLGGLGLALAEHLARRFQAKLVLTSRRGLPVAGDRDGYLMTRSESDATRRRIATVRRIEELGGEVVALKADVTSEEAMALVFSTAEKRFGGVDGVFHAAGVIDDALLQLKTTDDVDRVLAPKVRGTLVLDRVMRGRECDFLVLFSSISSYAGIAGQIDYSTANCFLDAYAQERSAKSDVFTVAINWSAWAEVGMARGEVTDETRGGGVHRDLVHAVLNSVLEFEGGDRIYRGELSAATHWHARRWCPS